jgi:hypothetical protein
MTPARLTVRTPLFALATVGVLVVGVTASIVAFGLRCGHHGTRRVCLVRTMTATEPTARAVAAAIATEVPDRHIALEWMSDRIRDSLVTERALAAVAATLSRQRCCLHARASSG